jgi:hypothetical protein
VKRRHRGCPEATGHLTARLGGGLHELAVLGRL